MTKDQASAETIRRLLLGASKFQHGDHVTVKWIGFPHIKQKPMFMVYVVDGEVRGGDPHSVRKHDEQYEGKRFYYLKQQHPADTMFDMTWALESEMELATDDDEK